MIIDYELTICPSYGWQGGPEFDTRIVALRGGQERRNQTSARVRHHYTLPLLNITDADYLAELKSVFLAMRGRLRGFLVKDRSDYLVQNEVFATGDGETTTFQLRRVVAAGPATYERLITRPRGAVVTVDGVLAAPTVDPDTGAVVFAAAPDMGTVLRWSGEFRVPVRFDSDTLPMTIDNRFAQGGYAMNGSVDLLEVWE